MLKVHFGALQLHTTFIQDSGVYCVTYEAKHHQSFPAP